MGFSWVLHRFYINSLSESTYIIIHIYTYICIYNIYIYIDFPYDSIYNHMIFGHWVKLSVPV